MRAVFVLCVLLGGSALKAEEPTKIEELQQEKVVLLKKIFDELSAGHKAGEGRIMDVYQAQLAYLDGTLDLAKTHQERMRIHQELVKTADELVKGYERLVKQAVAGRHDLLRAKTALLDRRIALAKEEQSGK